MNELQELRGYKATVEKLKAAGFPTFASIILMKQENEKLKALADNRGAFVDWVLEKYPDIAKEYNGF